MAVQHVIVTEKMIGTREPDLVRWPEVDVQGKPYHRGEVSMRSMGAHRFVVIPSALEGADKWEFELGSASFTASTDATFDVDLADKWSKGKK